MRHRHKGSGAHPRIGRTVAVARRGSRRALAPCIYQDASGLSVIVQIGGRPHERRYPLGTPLPELLEARDRLKRRQALARPAAPGTLLADVLAYLETIAEPRKRAHQQILCAHWVAAYGHLHRRALTPLVIRQQLAAWQRGGAAASSCNHRLSTLRAVWRAVAGPDEADYPRQVRKLPEPPPEPRALSYALIRRILDAMPDRGRGEKGQTRATVSLTKLRCTLMAYTGLPPAQIMRIVPETDIDWATPALRARPRRKGKGTRETWLPLIPQAVEALQAMVQAKAFGRYSNDSVGASWHRACCVVIAEQIAAGETPLPHRILEDGTVRPRVRVYDLRHSFGTLALALSGDKAGVQRLLLHADGRQTDRYTVAAVSERASQVAAQVGQALGAKSGRMKRNDGQRGNARRRS